MIRKFPRVFGDFLSIFIKILAQKLSRENNFDVGAPKIFIFLIFSGNHPNKSNKKKHLSQFFSSEQKFLGKWNGMLHFIYLRKIMKEKSDFKFLKKSERFSNWIETWSWNQKSTPNTSIKFKNILLF